MKTIERIEQKQSTVAATSHIESVSQIEPPIKATMPAWTSYAGEARRMVAAVRAMGLLK